MPCFMQVSYPKLPTIVVQGGENACNPKIETDAFLDKALNYGLPHACRAAPHLTWEG